MFYSLEILAIICVSAYIYAKWKFTYWKKRGIPFLEPNFPFGSYGLPNRKSKHPTEIVKKHYDHFKSLGHKHCGIFLTIKPMFIAIHPEIIRKILNNDLNNFVNHGFYYNAKDDPMSANLLFMEGKEWKRMREKLTPAFSSGKLKMMFQILIPCSDQFVAAVTKLLQTNEVININKFAECFSVNVMGSCAFGLECNSFDGEENEFRRYGQKTMSVLSPLEILKWFIAHSNKSLAHFLKISLLPQDVTDFFYKVFRDTVEFRDSTKYSRPDLMQLLINLKNEDQNISTVEIAAQAFIFFIIGSDTISSIFSFCLFELAANPNIQEKLRKEVENCTAKNNGNINYDNLFEMKYLKQVIDETIRKYPSANIISRICSNDYNIPNSDIILKKGTDIVIPVFALHYDPEYFPNPEKFDPERFNENNRTHIPPFAYLPFGTGPRNCIAARFGILIVKLAVAVTVKNFELTLNEGTLRTQKFDPFNISLKFVNPILLNVKKGN